MTSVIQHTLSRSHTHFKSSPGSAYGSSLIGSYLAEGAGHGRVHVHTDEWVFSIRRQIGVVCRWDIRDDHIHTFLLPFSIWVILLSLLKIRGMQGDRTIGQEWLGHFLSDPSTISCASMRALTLSAYFSLFLLRSFTLLLSSSCRFSSCRKRTAQKSNHTIQSEESKWSSD